MLKAIFFDMDETLCDTNHSNLKAIEALKKRIENDYPRIDSNAFVQRYADGFYKKLHDEYPELIELLGNELQYRTHLIALLGKEQSIVISEDRALDLQVLFDTTRMHHFDFFDGVKQQLIELRKHYTFVVITNGPTFSQYPKLKAVEMSKYVDHILVGGDEPEEKPAESIFKKALSLAKVEAHEVLHIGDSHECDIVGAAEVNIPSVWISHQSFEHSPLAAYTVNFPSQMFAVIKQHSQSFY
ncbi:HAD family hydrolase [Psychromonas ossibalaenae]|uniref:HAD family hydrolase n=1 Tax=Psychromonas ossibalaenae TaxID=444922 RepID=UPI00036AA730|nr:HAD family hydrolase [Psychromonas ossibalaenae]